MLDYYSQADVSIPAGGSELSNVDFPSSENNPQSLMGLFRQYCTTRGRRLAEAAFASGLRVMVLGLRFPQLLSSSWSLSGGGVGVGASQEALGCV